MSDDPREKAERYRFEQWQREQGLSPDDEQQTAEAPAQAARAYSAADRAAVVETAIQQAMRRGDFDDLPGVGKPIPGLGESHDPDWWIRRKIEREQLTGVFTIDHDDFETYRIGGRRRFRIAPARR